MRFQTMPFRAWFLMGTVSTMSDQITSISWGLLEGKRPRPAGSNARLGAHGSKVRVPLAQITTDDGVSGFGVCWASRERASELLGLSLSALFAPGEGVREAFQVFDYPLWDLAAKTANRPVYALAAEAAGRPIPEVCRAKCYDTSLYFDDLHLSNDDEAAALIASEAADGFALGHRAFKLKVGRGARWMEPVAGMRRDIAVIRAVRAAVGPDAPILLDANNGWNLNLTKFALSETADCGIYWMEEAFHEDNVLYRDLQEWLGAERLPTLIADGEGEASPSLLHWAREGLVNVVQYDIFGHGFTRWLQLGKQLDEWGACSAPHHYGGHLGNYVTGHLASAAQGFTFIEWDEVETPGLDGSGYVIEDGSVSVPNAPGFGLSLDAPVFAQAVANGGWAVRRG
jgi:L-rhamnonate dehydratase